MEDQIEYRIEYLTIAANKSVKRFSASKTPILNSWNKCSIWRATR